MVDGSKWLHQDKYLDGQIGCLDCGIVSGDSVDPWTAAVQVPELGVFATACGPEVDRSAGRDGRRAVPVTTVGARTRPLSPMPSVAVPPPSSRTAISASGSFMATISAPMLA